MGVRVITPPVPIVLPSDLSGGYGDDDALASSLIAAVTETIDGPTGWVGRALGPQTLEWSGRFWTCPWFTLPCRPVIGIDSVTYLDTDISDAFVPALGGRFDRKLGRGSTVLAYVGVNF